jgi:hypothetical protein
MTWKRQLYLLHRWVGIALCLFFALWFVSGFFMMYVGFPELTKGERLAGSMPLDFSTAHLDPAAAVTKLKWRDFTTRGTQSRIERVEVGEPLGDIGTPRAVRVSMIQGRPAYVVHPENGAQPRVVFADDGSVLREVTAESGRAAVADFARRSGLPIGSTTNGFEGRVHVDQWSVSGALDEHRPLLLYALNDDAGTVLYVSSRTGEVVRDTRRLERALNVCGAVIHWIYPTLIRKHPLVWEWVVDILASVGVALAISGLWIGWLRWNRRARPGKLQVPYRGLMRWHYFSGAIFGVVTVTWMFSGLLSMNPLNIDPPRRPETNQTLVYAGKPLTLEDFRLPAAGFGEGARDAILQHYAGQAFFRVTDKEGRTRLLAANEAASALPNPEAMIARAPLLLPEAEVISAEVLTAYDDYYYSRRPERRANPLPIVRVRFDDPRGTWFHLDPVAGQIVERSTRANRVIRWLYNGLHSFDIWWLWQRRPLWDIVVIVFSLGGAVLSMIGVVIGWRRLRYQSMRSASRAERASTRSEEVRAARRVQ